MGYTGATANSLPVITAGYMRICIAFLTTFAFAKISFAQHSPASRADAGTLNKIASYCSAASDYAKQHPDGALLFTAVPQNQDPARDKWHPASSDAFEFAAKNADSTAIASIRNGHVVFVVFSFQNQFGDSDETATYCYHPDGSLAKLHSDLKSYHGGLELVRDISFDATGREISNALHASDLQTHRSIRLPDDFWDLPPPMFLHVGNLPFGSRLPK